VGGAGATGVTALPPPDQLKPVTEGRGGRLSVAVLLLLLLLSAAVPELNGLDAGTAAGAAGGAVPIPTANGLDGAAAAVAAPKGFVAKGLFAAIL